VPQAKTTPQKANERATDIEEDGLSWSSKNEDNLPAAFLVLEKITKPGFQLNKAYTGCSID